MRAMDRRPPRIRKVLPMAVLLMLSGIVALAIFLQPTFSPLPWALENEEEAAPAVAPAETQAKVKIEVIHSGELPVQLHAVGTVVARRQTPASVVSWIGGIVTGVEVRDGQMLNSGAVILRLDPRVVKNALAKAQAGLRAVEADLQKAVGGGLDATQADLDLAGAQGDIAARQARQESDRQAALLAENLTSEKAATIARQAKEETERAAKAASDKARYYRTSGRAAELARLQAAVEQVKAEVRAAELDMQSAVIRAPQRGRVVRLDAHAGRMITPGTVVAQVIGDTASAVLVHVSPADAGAVRIGALVSVRSITTQTLSGKVVSVGVELDPDTGLVPVEAYLNPNRLLPRIGEAVYVDIMTKAPARGLVAPVSALSVKEDVASVFLVDANHIAHETPVRVLVRTADKAVIAGKGLADGVRVIVDGNYNLPDGARVVEEPAR